MEISSALKPTNNFSVITWDYVLLKQCLFLFDIRLWLWMLFLVFNIAAILSGLSFPFQSICFKDKTLSLGHGGLRLLIKKKKN